MPFRSIGDKPRFAAIARQRMRRLLHVCGDDLDRGGRLELLLPYATLEPVRELRFRCSGGKLVRTPFGEPPSY